MENNNNGMQGIPVKILEVVQEATSHEGYEPLRLVTPQGEIMARYYSLPSPKYAVIFVGGIGGGWDTPAQMLYPHLCRDFLNSGIVSLRIKFRDPRSLDDSVYDVASGLAFLHMQNIGAVGLVGHSFGGAVAISAAALDTSVKAVVTLATQSHGSGAVSELGPRCAVLLLHGSKDQVLPPEVSEHIYSLAHEPRRVIIYEGASHHLDETSMEVYEDVKDWIIQWVRER